MWRAVLFAAVSTTAGAASASDAPAAPVGDPPPVIDAPDTADASGASPPASSTTSTPTPTPTPTSTPTTPTMTPPTPPAPAERVRLVFMPGAFAGACPSGDEVQQLVVGHLGRDPFGEPAGRVLTLLLDGSDGAATRARLELLGPSLAPLGSRVVESSGGCADLVATAALQMAIALDPLAASPRDPAEVGGDAPATTPTAAPQPDPAAPEPEPDAGESAPDDEPRRRRRIVIVEEGPALVVGGDVHVANWLASDAPMLGFTAAAGVRGGMFSARTELRLDFGATSDDDEGALPALASIVPCAHVPLFDLGGEDGRFDASGCATLTAGALPELTRTVAIGGYAGAGLRVGLDWHLDSTSVVHFFGQSEVALWRAALVGAPTLSSTPLNVSVGVGFDIGDWE